MAYDHIFAALGDPSRRAVFDQLRQGPRAVTELAAALPISRPAVSQHLKILKAAGLVIDEPAGARRIYRLDTSGLAALRAWLDGFEERIHDAYQAEIQRQLDERKHS